MQVQVQLYVTLESVVFGALLGDQPGADVGPLISPQAKERVCSLIQSGVDEGAKLLLDGRKVNVKGYERGNFVGPTIISSVTVCGFNILTCTHAFVSEYHYEQV